MSLTDVIAGERAWYVACGDAPAVLREVPDGVFSCCVTSPPYWQLRDYGCAGQLGLEPLHDCAGWATGSPCGCCYVCHLVAVFREVRRCLHPSGTLWLNLGDSYNSNPSNQQNGASMIARGGARYTSGANPGRVQRAGCGLAPKSLLMIPARVALALQADGWVLRNEVAWMKRSPMPGSYRDRMTSATERIYLLAARGRYFYDQEAERVAMAEGSVERYAYAFGGTKSETLVAMDKEGMGVRTRPIGDREPNPDGRNLWDYWLDTDPDDEEPDDAPGALEDAWLLGSEPQKHSHYAAFPSIVPRRAIRLGSSPHGICPECCAPWVRATERSQKKRKRPNDHVKRTGEQGTGNACANTVAGTEVRTLGWQPTCRHGREPVPALVLDPFCGSGVTGKVAREEGRRFVGIDLSEKYCRLARGRIGSVAPLFD